MKKLLGGLLILSLNSFAEKAPGNGLEIQKILKCPLSLTVNLSKVPAGFTSLNGAKHDFISSYVSGNYARCTYQFSNYLNSQQAIWFYCAANKNVVEIADRTFICE